MYDEILNDLLDNTKKDTSTASKISNVELVIPEDKQCGLGNCLFNLDNFLKDLELKSQYKNKAYSSRSNSISSYDISSNCIRETIFKILNYPIEDFRDVWLPIVMRSFIGNAIHDFIQSTSTCFTESELSLKIPSIRTSCRMDNLINDNVLVEIKSCPYDDYSKILSSKRPRDADFKQTIFYRWLLHNHLTEAKQQPLETLRSSPPKLNKYNIKYIQYIYVAHDIIASDVSSMSQAISAVKKLKQLLNSRNNKFFFITVITLDLNTIDITPYEDEVIEKLNTINYCINNNIIPNKENRFIKNNCFFCLYKKICSTM
jgi:hypothetical protein